MTAAAVSQAPASTPAAAGPTGAGNATAEEHLALLRAYEPVLAFTRGELFLPVDACRYVEASALWLGRTDEAPRELVPAGELDVARLVEEAAKGRAAPLHLRFVDRPLSSRAYRQWRRQPDRPRLQARSRFAKVGLIARFSDALFRLALLMRGRVPGGFAAAAEIRTDEVFAGSAPTYHGRVVRDGGYVVLQYWFFYVMNDWRSTFGGVNDHEADWELVSVYLARREDGEDGEDGSLEPRWVGLSVHDEAGDELRRRRDDPDLAWHGNHPVINVGAGSHSHAVLPGDYVISVDPPLLRRVAHTAVGAIRRVAPWVREPSAGFGIPYVDYARGDGLRVGPGGDRPWHATVIDDDTPWVRHFRGLWGLDTEDRFGGERAPAGPRYERDGRVRRSWGDPLGWVGLHKVPPNEAERRRLLEERVEALDREVADLDDSIDAARRNLRAEATVDDRRREQAGARRSRRVLAAEGELAALAARRSALDDESGLARMAMAHPPTAEGPHAHLRHRRLPYGGERNERDRFLRVWATISSPLLVGALVLLVVGPPGGLLTATAVLLFGFLTVEAVARRRGVAFLGAVAVILGLALLSVAIVAAIVANWRLTVSVALGAAAVLLLFLNLSDLRRR